MVKIITSVKREYYSKNGSKISYSKARKEHFCKTCGNAIKKGEKQKTISFTRNYNYFTIYICKECW